MGHRQYYLSPEDLIAVFGHCQIVHGLLVQCPPGGKFDNDGNGYPNDISGWNFDHNNNDPQTDDTTYSHAPGLNSLIAGVADNHYGSVGYCPRCRVVAVKQGAECLGRTDRWGESILYATDLGATAISSVVVGYTFSRFNQDAIDYAYNKGVALSLDSNDFDSMDHTDGMLFDHVIPGNSLVEDKATTGAGPANTASTVTWFRERHPQHLPDGGRLHLGGDADGGLNAGDDPVRRAQRARRGQAGDRSPDTKRDQAGDHGHREQGGAPGHTRACRRRRAAGHVAHLARQSQ
jgi:hypothetical protein